MKAKEKEEIKEHLYDQSAVQKILLEIVKNEKTFRVSHTLNPLTDARYFQFQKELENISKHTERVASDLYKPKYNVWFDLVQSREGYTENTEWKTATKEIDAVKAINALLYIEIVESPVIEAELLLDDDELTAIKFKALQSGVLIDCAHNFRNLTKADIDEYIGIQINEPEKTVTPGDKSLTRAEKLYNLGKKVLADCTGYAANSNVPAWHLTATTEQLFLKEFARMGKL